MPGLFSPLTIKHFTLTNRIVLPPMANNMSDDSGAVTDKHIQHYVRRAKAGVGMVIVEHAYVRTDGRVNKAQLGIHNDALIPVWGSLSLSIIVFSLKLARMCISASASTRCYPTATTSS